jgi:hypothetical protein
MKLKRVDKRRSDSRLAEPEEASRSQSGLGQVAERTQTSTSGKILPSERNLPSLFWPDG